MAQSIFDAVTPRPDVLSGELKDEVFAANIEQVVEDKADPVYQDYRTFFENTFPTSGLKSLLEESLGRVSGKKPNASPVIRLETSFGGGKTHSLIALYHLGCKVKPAKVENFVNPDYLPDKPLKMAIVSGTRLDPTGLGKDPKTFTLWGELAKQLGNYEVVSQSDQSGIAPGTETIREFIGSEPTIIIMDELANYFEKASAKRIEASTLADQTLAFFMSLLEVGATSEHLSVVYTLASSGDAFGDQTERVSEEARQRLDQLRSAHKISARIEHVIRPTGENEIAYIVRHRLFEKWHDGTAGSVAKEYATALQKEFQQDTGLPAEANSPGYREDIVNTYPFHPALITGLNEYVSTIPNFQKTRGALRLLALVVRSLWEQNDKKPFDPAPRLIHIHHIDLDPGKPILSDLTSRLQRNEYTQVVESDIINRMKGEIANAVRVDQELIERGRPPLAGYAATTIFIHSLVQGIPGGIVLPHLLLAMYSPGADIGMMKRQLFDLTDIAFYLHRDEDRFRFTPEPSLPAIVNRQKEGVTIAATRNQMEKEIKGIWKSGSLSPVYFPVEPADIDDSYNRVRLVVMGYQEGGYGNPNIASRIVSLFKNAGSSGSFRSYRNHVMFLTVRDHSEDQIEEILDAVKRKMAINNMFNDTQFMAQFNREQKRWFENNLQETEAEITRDLTRLYSVLLIPNGKADNGGLEETELPSQDSNEAKANQIEFIVNHLREMGKIEPAGSSPAPQYVAQRAWPAAKPERATPLDIIKEYARNTGLRILLNTEVLRDTIRAGVASEVWGFYDPADKCVWVSDSESKTAKRPNIVLDDKVELVLIEHLGDLEPCPLSPPNVKCERCGNLKSECSCNGDHPPPVCTCTKSDCTCTGICKCDTATCPCYDSISIYIEAVNSGVEATQEIIDKASDLDWEGIERIVLKTDPALGKAAISELVMLSRAVPQLPRGDVTTKIDFSAGFKDGHLEFEFNGEWTKYKTFHEALIRDGEVSEATGTYQIDLKFLNPVTPSGNEMQALKKIFGQYDLGRVTIGAYRYNP